MHADYEALFEQTKKQSLAQAQGPYGNAGPEGKGPTYPSPQPFVRGEKQWMDNAQNIGDWGAQQEVVANTRIPYQSTAQLQGPYGNAGANGKGPTYPSPQPFVRGEKQWMDNAQNIGDWGDQQMIVANTRIPYASTLVQTEGVGLYGNAGPDGKGPTLPSPQPFIRGEKQWIPNAQNIEDWGIQQVNVANTRIPYASTLLQTETEGPAPYGIIGEAGHLGGPAAPSPQPFIRGEKQWIPNAQNIEDWGIQQVNVANTRIPYASTLVQTSDNKKDDDEPDMSILYEKEEKNPGPEKIQTLGQIPLDTHFVQTRSKDDDPKKMEGMLMEDPEIPLNLRLIQQDDDASKIETMAMEDPEIP